MSLSLADFWRLVVESRLLSPDQCQQLGSRYGQAQSGADRDTAKAVAAWLVSINAISRYQAAILLAGRAGPFHFGDYRVYDRLEHGRLRGMFRAVHVHSNHPCLLHFMSGAAASDPAVWAWVAAQTQARAAAGHPHLLRYFQAIDLGSYKFLVSEDIAGESVEDVIGRTGRLPPQDAARLGWQAALGLGQLHQLGQVHSDVAPASLWLEPSGQIKVIHDPALIPFAANLSSSDPNQDRRSDYWAPEMAQPGQMTNSLTDVYGLGCSLYYLLSGSPPFSGGNALQKLARHAREPIRPLEPLGVPAGLAQIVAYSMAKNPAVRFPHAQVLAEQLASFVDPGQRQTAAATAPTTLAAFERWLATPTISAAVVAPTPVPFAAARSEPTVSIQPTHMPTAAERLRESRIPKRKHAPIVLACTGVVALIVIGGLVVMNAVGDKGEIEASGRSPTGAGTESSNGESGKGGDNSVERTGHDSQSSRSAPTKTAGPEVVADDGRLLWASPTSGAPIDLANIPPGGQLYLHIRMADVLQSAEGARVLESLGPQFARLRADWETNAGLQLSQVDTLIWALYANGGAFPRSAMVVRLKEPRPQEELLTNWKNPAEQPVEGGKYYKGASWCYYLPNDAEGRTFVMGEEEDVKEAAQAQGAPPVLRKDLQKLQEISDSDRHVTLLVAPNFLFSELFPEGRTLYFGDAKRVRQPLEWLLGDNLQAVLVSAHFGDDFFWEARLVSNLSVAKSQLATDLKSRIEQVPDSMRAYVVRLGSNTYWENVRFQFPQMIRFMHRMSRVGVDADCATINGVLPASAAHNLAFGAEMVMASTPGITPATGGTAANAGNTKLTIDDAVYKYKMKMSFQSQTLEFAIADLVKDVNEGLKGLSEEFRIVIIGRDLEKDGITRNQTIRDFEQSGKTVAEILTALAMKANPVPNIEEASNPEQKLVWVIEKDPENAAKTVVLITTRAASEAKKYKLPAPFLTK